MMGKQFLLAIIVFIGFSWQTSAAQAQTRPSFRVCTQNAHMLGEAKKPRPSERRKKKKSENKQEQIAALAERIVAANCDLVALQEIYGRGEKAAERSVRKLTTAIEKQSSQQYYYVLGRTNDRHIRNGFIYRKEKVQLEETDHYHRYAVPTLNKLAPTRRFVRGPVGILISVHPADKGGPQKFYIIAFHFKSRVDGWKDLSKTDFEIDRLETAEALREIVVARQKELGASVPIIVMGDRNSDSDDAAVAVLNGALRLEHFRKGCRVNSELHAECGVYPSVEPVLTGIFDQERKRRGTGSYDAVYSYRYRRNYYLYDEIMVTKEHYDRFFKQGGATNTSLVGQIGEGSDHLLMMAEVSWP